MDTSIRERPTLERGFSVDPREIVYSLRRKKWWILTAGIVVAGATAAGTSRQPKIYQAVAQIMIEPAVPKVLSNDLGLEELSERARVERVFNNTQYKTITSRAVLADVSTRLDLPNDADFKRTSGITATEPEALDKAIEAVLVQNISVQPEIASRIVSLIVEDQDPDRAAKIANTVGQAYIDYTLDRRLETVREASKFLDEQVVKYAERLEDAERKLHEFKESNTLLSVSLEDRQNTIAAKLSILNQKVVETRSRLIELKASRRVLQGARAKSDDVVAATPRLADNEVISELRRALVTLDKQRAELSTRYGTKHPRMVAVEKQITETDQAIEREVALVVASFDNEVEALEATLRGLEEEIASEKDRAFALGKLALDYSKLTRDLGTTRTTYESLLKRQTDADLTSLLKSNFVQWFQGAEPKPAAVRPSLPKNTALGLFVGLMLGILVAVAGVLLDNTVRSQSDIEQFVNLPFLGVVPSIEEETSPDSRDLYILHHPKSGVAECARSIRTNLLFMGTEKPLRKILLTSAGPAEGKTTTAIHLGVTMAQAGNRVLLVDTDLRKPRLHRAFGVSGEGGLSSVLVETVALEDAIKSTDVPGLQVLPCGPLPPNPAELFHTERFRALLERISERYDRVLLDSPPIGAVTDAAILSQQMDGTLLVVRANKTAKEAVRRAARSLHDVDANILGVVLNDFDVAQGAYGNQQYYYYHYYRGYGRGESEEEAKA